MTSHLVEAYSRPVQHVGRLQLSWALTAPPVFCLLLLHSNYHAGLSAISLNSPKSCHTRHRMQQIPVRCSQIRA
jgi:hypothetical protein